MIGSVSLPAGFCVARVEIENGCGPHGDRHGCGRAAARRALEELGEDPARLTYDGSRPLIRGGGAAISITHNRAVALAIAARVGRLGIDRCDDDPRLPGLAVRFLVDERSLIERAEMIDTVHPLRSLAACFAAKEAALKALGLGLVDGGVLDGTAIRVVSLDPPRLSQPELQLALGRLDRSALAVVYA